MRSSTLSLDEPDSSTNVMLDGNDLAHFVNFEAQREPTSQMDDVDLTFLSELLSQDSNVPNATIAVMDSVPSPSSSSHSMDNSDSADSAKSPEDLDGAGGSERKRKLGSPPESADDDGQTDDRNERRRVLSAKNARRYRSRKKNELVTLKEQVFRFEEQLKALRLKHHVFRADSAVACWEEKAIVQRLRRRQAEEFNEQLQLALFTHTGFVRKLRSIFTESAPPSIALNMRHFLHMYTHLRKDPQLRARDLGAVSSAAKIDRAMQVVLRETATIPVTTSPEILFQELDLGTEGLGKTSTAVYAFNTRDSSKAFDVACKAILTTCGVWPDHSRVESSTKFVDVPPTEFNVQYGITKHCYQHNATKAQAWTEARDLYYSRMTGSCGVLVWDFVDADDMYPFKGSTFIKRNTVGALVLRPEMCSDGVDRMVCRSICSDMQILVNSPKPSLNVAEFALLEDMMVYKTIKEGATDWHDTVAMEQTDDSSARRKALAMTADEPVLTGLTPGLQSSASIGLGFLDVEILVPGEMELQTGALVDEPLQLNTCGVVGHCSTSNTMDDLDMNFLSDLLQPDSSSQVEFLPTSNESGESSPTDSPSSDAADTCSSTEEHVRATTGAARSKRAKKTPSSPSSSEFAETELEREQDIRLTDRKARRRAQVASSARRLRCRKKCEMITLKTEVNFLEQQLETLRSKHKQMRANNAVAAWEESAIAQRLKRRHAEKTNEQLRQALFLQSGFVRNLRSMFSDTMPCSIELNMRNFLHTPTRLLKDQHSRVRNLESVCTDTKLDMAKQIIMEETGGIKPFTTPHIACQQIDLGRDGFGMTTVAVYALETRNACKTFKAACSAIMNCAAVWPSYTLVTSSSKAADLPPTKLNIRYGMSHNIYESDATGDRVSVESREISYYRMTKDCGIFLWDYVDADDMNPMPKETTTMRCTIGAVLVRPEVCIDGVERIVCRNICTKVHLLDSSELTPSLERFSKSRQRSAQICGSLVYESIKNDAANSPC
ncbi:hypothetical protein PC129_g801 [Phytophthora cactorum]|uniref:BZIP domain-containing protein n=1 Tax=Phytophthora cactorum TaxID=29920 RepID=A0A8T0ZZW4_9STRA|nr:hypothetical protein Pcac1_g1964 [Phytophthora cactorum]KAG2837711.1 hypothetical protein PC111_g4514 [Phytophthora cactorum]KAG2845521.1 hypothetical protein PC112_g1824 [Phytophthora cactorum]KAG2867920.1 hypothetical protein PC113_g1570 [Phytophthora cactorum]KAG2932798.1 hypothetical protein PC114_g1715 [Phytophthora cactorum]